MEENNEDILEANWVFVEEVDIAEEAFPVETNKENNSDDKDLLQDISEKLSDSNSKSISDLELVNFDDGSTKCSQEDIESDIESDGISIISNWSCSHSAQEDQNSDEPIEYCGAEDNYKADQLNEETGQSEDEVMIPPIFEERDKCVEASIGISNSRTEVRIINKLFFQINSIELYFLN